jgi:hypothetical protein
MKVSSLHNEALELAEKAFLEKQKNSNQAIKLFKEALHKEKEAAFLAKNSGGSEKTTAVLFRSAASLALNASEFREAEKLAGLVLSGNPPFEIAEEVRNILEEVNFARHLDLKGITLGNTDLQFVIAGKGVAMGMAKSNLVFDRLEILEQLTLRTIERLSKKPFRERGNISNQVKDLFTYYYSVPRAASFALTIRIGKTKKQTEISGLEKSKDIIDDLLENIDLINNGNENRLKQNISDPAYFRNFFSLTKELAPDGDEVSLVGFTVIRGNKEKKFQFTKKKSELATSFTATEGIKKNSNKNLKKVELKGTLSAADSDNHNLRLKVEGSTSRIFIKVPQGLGDIVKKYWEEKVIIKGIQLPGNSIQLIDIDSAK